MKKSKTTVKQQQIIGTNCSAGKDAYEAVAGLIIHVGNMVPNIPVVLQITRTHGIIAV